MERDLPHNPRTKTKTGVTPIAFNRRLYENALTCEQLGTPLVVLPSVDSTNSYLARQLDAELPLPGVVMADVQSAGRGRFGREWISPTGRSLAFSFTWKPPLEFTQPAGVTLIIGLALCHAIRRVTTLPPQLKYPNDVIMQDKKIAGILAELKQTAEGPVVIIGVGLNVNTMREDFPPSLREKATSLALETAKKWQPEELLATFFNEAEPLLNTLNQSGLAPLMEAYRACCSTVGQSVVVGTGVHKKSGVAEGIDDEGRLIIRLPDGTTHCILSGEVSFHDGPARGDEI